MTTETLDFKFYIYLESLYVNELHWAVSIYENYDVYDFHLSSAAVWMNDTIESYREQ